MSRAGTCRSSNSLTPSRTAWKGSFGVDGTFVIVISPESSLKKTKSENVPPVSTVTRYFAIAVSSIIKPRGLQSEFSTDSKSQDDAGCFFLTVAERDTISVEPWRKSRRERVFCPRCSTGSSDGATGFHTHSIYFFSLRLWFF